MPIKPEFNTIQTEAPGRICLFGDDFYEINGSAIIGTISPRLTIQIQPRKDQTMIIREPDIASHDAFSMYRKVPFTKYHDVLRGVFNSLMDQGSSFPHGGNSQVRSKIPMSAGLASSEALSIAWTALLLLLLKRKVNPEKIASIAHISEINGWHISNRFVDFLVIARGGLYNLNPRSEPPLRKIKAKIKGLILCELAPYGTIQGVWRQRIQEAQDVLAKLRKTHATPDFIDLQIKELPQEIKDLPIRHRRTISGFLKLRELTQKAGTLLQTTKVNELKLAKLINDVQKIYQTQLKINIPIIKKIRQIGDEEGILSLKLIGPNWGRMLLLYAPDAGKRIQSRLRNELKLRTLPIRLSNKGITVKID